MAISRQPRLSAPVRRYGNGEHTTRKATDRHPDAAFTLAEQQMHIPSAPGIPAEAGHQFPLHYKPNKSLCVSSTPEGSVREVAGPFS